MLGGPWRSSWLGVIEWDAVDDMLLFMVPVREKERPPMAINASARSKTLPLNALANEALCGVDGTVACTAGPRAAL